MTGARSTQGGGRWTVAHFGMRPMTGQPANGARSAKSGPRQAVAHFGAQLTTGYFTGTADAQPMTGHFATATNATTGARSARPATGGPSSTPERGR